MSARDTITPGRAFEQLNADLNARLTEAARRIRWSGAANDFAEFAPQQLAITSAASPVPTWNNIASINLPQGRWLLLGNTSIQNTGPAVTAANRISLGMRFVTPAQSTDPLGVALSDNGRLVDDWETSTGFLWAWHFGQEATVRFDVDTQVIMQVFAATLGAQGNAAAARTRLTGVPA
jgi:hypothetical protein